MTDIPRCPECGSTRWTRELRPDRKSWRESIDIEEGEQVYRSTWVDPGTGMAWQDNILPDQWVCGKGHILASEDEAAYDLDELTLELEVKGW